MASIASQWYDVAITASTSQTAASASNTDTSAQSTKTAKREARDKGGMAGGRPHPLAPRVVGLSAVMFVVAYSRHAWWACTEGYATPAVLVTARTANGSTVVYDDFRETYVFFLSLVVNGGVERCGHVTLNIYVSRQCFPHTHTHTHTHTHVHTHTHTTFA